MEILIFLGCSEFYFSFNIFGIVWYCFLLFNIVIGCFFSATWAPGNKEISRKAYVLRQSLSKMESVCYNIQIRGTEIPKHMLMSVIESAEITNDVDEGFF